jgi:Domain of unknown function (DUF4396)
VYCEQSAPRIEWTERNERKLGEFSARVFRDLIGTRIKVNSVEFWFMMQIAMCLGFPTSYPVNWWLISSGVKERM